MKKELDLIIYKRHEKLPLQAYYWEIRDTRKETEFRRFVINQYYNTNKYEPHTFYKPINLAF